jgi:protein NrfD
LSYRESTWLKPMLCLAAFFAILYPSQSGAFFGVVDSKPYWHSPILPMLFLSAAVAGGTGLLMLTRWIVGPEDDSTTDQTAGFALLRKILLVSLITYFVFEFAEFSISLWSPNSHAPELELVLYGPYWWVFWIVHLLIGGLISLILLLQRSLSGWIIASFLVVVTMVSGRLNVLIPGQAVNEIKGLQEAFWHDRLNYIYHATPMEYFVGLFLVAVGMAVFYIGRRINQGLQQVSQARGAK